MRIFVDTSAWAALYDRSDVNHDAAAGFLRGLKGRRVALITTDYVLDETLTLIRMRVGHTKAVDFGRWIFESEAVEVEEIDGDLWREAWEIFVRYSDKDFSFTDCTSFALMRRMGLSEAFSFDKHFSQFGFTLLP